MIKFFHKIFTFLKIIISCPIFLFSFFVPRDKNLWVFIGWHNSPDGEIFADNCKYFFLYVNQNHPEIKSVWLAKNKKLAKTLTDHGYHAYYQNNLRGIWCALLAGFTFVDAYIQRENFQFMGKTKIVQLMHGRGMKKEGYSHKQLRQQNYIFAPSEDVLKMLGQKFVDNAKTFVTGYSRNSVLYCPIKDSDISVDQHALLKLKEIKENKNIKIILYAPTFRRGIKEYNIEKYLNISKWPEWLRENNIFLFINLHPKYRAQIRNLNLKNIFFIEESDIYPLLPYFDSLITDYSSIFADFLILDKPIVFYPYDRDIYSKEEGFYYDYDKFTPGPKAYNSEELMKKIKESFDKDIYKEERKKICDYYHRFKDHLASERIFKILDQELNTTRYKSS